jgi:hypothetical protein
MEAEKIKKELETRGYIHIPFSVGLTEKLIKEQLGENLFTTLIKENPQSTRLLASNADVDLHTDHIKAKYIAWQCNSQAANGGESLLLDSKDILRNTSSQLLSALESITVKCHRLFYGDRSHYPLFDQRTQILYYASFLCEKPISPWAQDAYSWFQIQVKNAGKTELKLSEGDWLIIDNHRMLHGRKGFQTKSNRLLTRYWLSGQVNKYTHKK